MQAIGLDVAWGACSFQLKNVEGRRCCELVVVHEGVETLDGREDG